MGARKTLARLMSGVVGRGCHGTSCLSVQHPVKACLGLNPAPNKGLELAAGSVSSRLAPASGGSSRLAL